MRVLDAAPDSNTGARTRVAAGSFARSRRKCCQVMSARTHVAEAAQTKDKVAGADTADKDKAVAVAAEAADTTAANVRVWARIRHFQKFVLDSKTAAVWWELALIRMAV